MTHLSAKLSPSLTPHLLRTQLRNKARGAAKRWYRVENADTDEPTMFIYSEIGMWGVTADDFVRDLEGLDTDRLTLRLNSPGGEVFDGITIYNALVDHKADVNVVVDGMAASAASFIAMAGDTVTMNRQSRMMIHDAQGAAIGDASVMAEMGTLLDSVSTDIAELYASRAGGDADEWRTRMKATTWFSAEEAVAANLADKVAGDDEDEGDEDEPTNAWRIDLFAPVQPAARADSPLSPTISPYALDPAVFARLAPKEGSTT